ncbi:hypothetical protein [Novosphingobium sp. PASSN1]|uniref:hypothetical protein n=1 Tax=Novosphingobium sp. PASSN1 TaxID=2015561 RepID=UPI000BC473AC|nr:hypothetical protein [Novosphingobium sp. PASSN1]OYU34163.1 MAG: hypothetical protein CFE35_16200 [Novosphingobium sp. PASSN1]
MTPNTNTFYAFTTSHCILANSFLPSQRSAATSRTMAAPRRTSAVLSAQELRQLVCEMVD